MTTAQATIMESTPSDGAAALSALLLHFYEDDIPEAEVEAHLWNDGAPTLTDLKSAALAFGFESLLVSCSCRALSTLSCPTIVCLGADAAPNKRYCVVLDIDAENVQVLHPEDGVSALPVKEFMQRWEGAGDASGRALAVFPYVGLPSLAGMPN